MLEAIKTEAEYTLAKTHKRLMDEGRMDLSRLSQVEATLAKKHTPYTEVGRSAKPYPYRDMGVANRFLLDEPTAEGIQHQDVPSRQRFESLLALIPQDVIDGVVERCEARIWDLAKRYYRCMYFFAKRESEIHKQLKALVDEGERQIQALTGCTLMEYQAAQKSGRLPHVIRKKLDRDKSNGKSASTMSPVMNPLMSPDYAGIDPADPMGLRGDKSSMFVQNAMPVQDEVQLVLTQIHIITGKILAEQEKLEKRLNEFEHERSCFNLTFGTMKGDDPYHYFCVYGEEVAQIMSDLPIGDPYETCFAFLYMIDRGHDLMGCNFVSSTVLSTSAFKLPWSNGQYRLEDDII